MQRKIKKIKEEEGLALRIKYQAFSKAIYSNAHRFFIIQDQVSPLLIHNMLCIRILRFNLLLLMFLV